MRSADPDQTPHWDAWQQVVGADSLLLQGPGVIGLTEDHKVAVSSHFIGRSATADALVLSLVDSPVLDPQAGQPRPHAGHLSWHGREVFRGPARVVAG
jgi:hypothetical protein